MQALCIAAPVVICGMASLAAGEIGNQSVAYQEIPRTVSATGSFRGRP